MVGEHITFHCQAEGNPTPVTRWYLNKQRLQPDTNYIIMEGMGAAVIFSVQLKFLKYFTIILFSILFRMPAAWVIGLVVFSLIFHG